MTAEERKQFIKELSLEASKAILSNIDLEKQYRRKSEGGCEITSYVGTVASAIVVDFVRRTVYNLEEKGLL